MSNFDSETIDQLAILKLIAGLRTAFASSIAGIVASIMTSVVIRDLMIRYGELKDAQQSEAHEDRLARLRADQHILDDDPEINLAYTAKSLHDQLGQGRINQAIGLRIDQSVAQLLPAMQSTNSLLDGYLKRQSELNTVALKEVMDTFNREFGASLKGHFEGMSQTLREFQQWNEHSRKLYDESTRQQAELMRSIAALLDQEHQLRDERQRLLRSTEQLIVGVDKVVGMTPLLVELRDSQRTTHYALDLVSTQLAALNKLGNEASPMLGGLARSVNELTAAMQSTHAAQAHALESMGILAGALSGMDGSMRGALELQREMASRLEVSAAAFERGGEAITAAKEGLQSAAQEMGKINAQVAATREAQESIARSMNQTLEALRQQNPLIEEWKEVIQEIGPLIEAQGATNTALLDAFHKLQQTSEALKTPLVRIDTSIDNFAAKSGELHTAINNAPVTYKKSIESMKDGINKTFNDVDVNISNIVRHLKGAIESNRDQQQDIYDVLTELRELLASGAVRVGAPSGAGPAVSSAPVAATPPAQPTQPSRTTTIIGGLEAIRGPGERDG